MYIILESPIHPMFYDVSEDYVNTLEVICDTFVQYMTDIQDKDVELEKTVYEYE